MFMVNVVGMAVGPTVNFAGMFVINMVAKAAWSGGVRKFAATIAGEIRLVSMELAETMGRGRRAREGVEVDKLVLLILTEGDTAK